MALTVICLAMLAVFANVQRSRRDAVEVVAVKLTILLRHKTVNFRLTLKTSPISSSATKQDLIRRLI